MSRVLVDGIALSVALAAGPEAGAAEYSFSVEVYAITIEPLCMP